jgi:hypothetical protein
MTRFFSFFEGTGSTGLGLITSGCGTYGGGATTGAGAATTGRTAGHEQPAVQTIAMSEHIRKIIFLFIGIPLYLNDCSFMHQIIPFSSIVKKISSCDFA